MKKIYEKLQPFSNPFKHQRVNSSDDDADNATTAATQPLECWASTSSTWWNFYVMKKIDIILIPPERNCIIAVKSFSFMSWIQWSAVDDLMRMMRWCRKQFQAYLSVAIICIRKNKALWAVKNLIKFFDTFQDVLLVFNVRRDVLSLLTRWPWKKITIYAHGIAGNVATSGSRSTLSRFAFLISIHNICHIYYSI